MVRPTTLKLYEFDDSTFINGCYIPNKICDDLINYFDDNLDKQVSGKVFEPGRRKGIENDNVKKSMDITFNASDCEDQVRLKDYIYNLDLCIREYEYKYIKAKEIDSYSIQESIQLQKYEPGEGYKAWHCERTGISQIPGPMTRCLAFMTYLNDVPTGGTDFMYQKITTPAKKGLTLIWPTDWTHTHKGQISQTHKKYIITGWLNYTN